MRQAVWFVLGLFFIAASVRAGQLDSFLPQSGEITGWTTYRWPQDENDLYRLIDGAGMVFIDHGFQEAVFQHYADESLIELELEIYDQGSPANAESTYHDPVLETGWEVPSDDFGVEGRVDTSALASHKSEFWRDRYFVRGTVFQKSSYGLQGLAAFCQLVDQKLMGKSAVDGLPDNGEIPGWNRYAIAEDSMTIGSLLGGEGGLFLEWGCTAGLKQDYYDSQFVLLQLELFDQATPANAQALFHDPRLETGQEIPRDDFGQGGRLDTTSSWTYSAQFWRDQYVARLLVQEKSEASLADLVAFCQLVDEKIQATLIEKSSLSPPREAPLWEPIGAHPNPFNDHVLIRYGIPEGRDNLEPFQLGIYNVAGQMIRQLAEGREAAPGLRTVCWDGRDDRGKSVASGVYFLRLCCGSSMRTAKVVLCR
jgi:hypothetical protein